MDIAISIIIPAYNEAQRLPVFLDSVRSYLAQRYPDRHEVIIVDDGSRDNLADVLGNLTEDWPGLLVIRHAENQGKGAAVRTGMLAARGERLLFADADGATPIDQEAKLTEAIHHGADVAIGSRLAADAGVTRCRTWRRALIGRLFAVVARRWLHLSVRDTQCGFKMFRREVGRKLFSTCEETGYLFDLELLMSAEHLGYRIAEVPVNWSDVAGGNLSPANQLGAILAALWRLRRRDLRK